MIEPPRRFGFALLTVLWLLATIGVVAVAAAAIGRDEFNASENRIALNRAWWSAEGCVAEVLSAIDDSLSVAGNDPGAQVRLWRALDRVVDSTTPSDSTCVVSAEAAGSRLDVNQATPEQLDRFFDGLGLSQSSSLTDALLDWIDQDDVPRPDGAEADWYRSQRRPLPRNGPLADPREITRIRGFEDLADIERFISTEDSRICVATAPAEVLAAIPAFSPPIVENILSMRAANRPINDLSLVLDGVPESDADSAMSRFSEILRLTTLDPEAWLLSARAAIRPSAPSATVDVRIALNGRRPLVTRTRVSP